MDVRVELEREGRILYYDLGKVTYSAGVLVDPFTPAGAQPPNPAFFTNAVQATTRFEGHIVRVGVQLLFHLTIIVRYQVRAFE